MQAAWARTASLSELEIRTESVQQADPQTVFSLEARHRPAGNRTPVQQCGYHRSSIRVGRRARREWGVLLSVEAVRRRARKSASRCGRAGVFPLCRRIEKSRSQLVNSGPVLRSFFVGPVLW